MTSSSSGGSVRLWVWILVGVGCVLLVTGVRLLLVKRDAGAVPSQSTVADVAAPAPASDHVPRREAQVAGGLSSPERSGTDADRLSATSIPTVEEQSESDAAHAARLARIVDDHNSRFLAQPVDEQWARRAASDLHAALAAAASSLRDSSTEVGVGAVTCRSTWCATEVVYPASGAPPLAEFMDRTKRALDPSHGMVLVSAFDVGREDGGTRMAVFLRFKAREVAGASDLR